MYVAYVHIINLNFLTFNIGFNSSLIKPALNLLIVVPLVQQPVITVKTGSAALASHKLTERVWIGDTSVNVIV